MSISQTSGEKAQHTSICWSTLAPYMSPSVAAFVSYFPVSWLLSIKNRKQLELLPESLSFKTHVVRSFKTSRLVFGIVGLQMASQHVIEKSLDRLLGQNTKTAMLISLALVSAASAPSLSVLNSTLSGLSFAEATTRLSKPQLGAIWIREMGFLGVLAGSDRVVAYTKEYLPGAGSEYIVAACSGAVGSLIVHPFDTAVTRLQEQKPIGFARYMMNGAATRAVAIALFSMLYRAASQTMNPRNPP
jgi:hypothetical protein